MLPKVLCRFAVAALALAAFLQPARAEYPDHIITAIVPFAPGGSNDIVARIISPYIAKLLSQTVVILNKPGAAGNIGILATTQAPADGYTLLFSATASTQNPALFKKLPFDPLADIQPVAQLGEDPFVIVVRKDLPVKTLKDLIDLAKKAPEQLSGAAGGIGTRLSIALLDYQYNIKTTIVDYDGTGPAATAVLTGEADFAVSDPQPLLSAVRSGNARVLAVAGAHRLSMFPDAPTTAEAGFPDFTAGAPYGVYVRSGTPEAIVTKLNATINQITTMPEIVKRFEALGITMTQKTPAEFNTLYRSEIAKWKTTVTNANIHALDE
jgi:tripartite-type tricarboxylate transporter receptor subunit TctC